MKVPGIPDNYKKSIFQRYMQVEARDVIRNGVGLGLTFCRMVIEAHGGEICVEDNPEGGQYLFTLILPISVESEVENSRV